MRCLVVCFGMLEIAVHLNRCLVVGSHGVGLQAVIVAAAGPLAMVALEFYLQMVVRQRSKAVADDEGNHAEVLLLSNVAGAFGSPEAVVPYELGKLKVVLQKKLKEVGDHSDDDDDDDVNLATTLACLLDQDDAASGWLESEAPDLLVSYYGDP